MFIENSGVSFEGGYLVTEASRELDLSAEDNGQFSFGPSLKIITLIYKTNLTLE